MIGTYGILGVSEHGWGSAQTLILGVLSAALFAGFIARQARVSNPLMPLGIFRNRNLSGANAIQALLVAGMFGMFFLGALYLQRILDYDALEVGLAFLPTTVAMGTLSLGFSEKLIMRFGPRTTLIPGVAMVGVGLLLFARTPVDGNYLTDLLPPLLLVGVGVGTSFPSLMTLAMSGASPSEAGLASGIVNTSMQVGGAIGLAVLATLAAERTDGREADGVAHLEALNSGYHLAYLIGAVLVAVALVVAVVVLRQPSPAEMAEMAAAHDGASAEQGEREPRSRPTKPARRKGERDGTAGRSLRGDREGRGEAARVLLRALRLEDRRRQPDELRDRRQRGQPGAGRQLRDRRRRRRLRRGRGRRSPSTSRCRTSRRRWPRPRASAAPG